MYILYMYILYIVLYSNDIWYVTISFKGRNYVDIVWITKSLIEYVIIQLALQYI